ncbi:MAG TPA: hypothetical protein VGE65_09620 [Sphingobium sp.]
MSASNDPENSDQPRRAGDRFRLDLKTRLLSADKESGIFRMVMEPDPRRYDKIERDEPGLWYIDKYFNTMFDFRDFASPEMVGLPIHASGRTVETASEYAEDRRKAVAQELASGDYSPPTQAARPHQSIDPNSERDIAFISVDICGSTALRRADSAGFEKARKILVRELGTTVGQFQGSILKTTGDGFIGYIDHPGFTTLVDSAIDLGGTLLRILHVGVNEALRQEGLPTLSVRIGADYGPAEICEVHVPLTGFAASELQSDALNRAVKIEQSCKPDTFRIGYDLYRLAHVQWLERCHQVPFDSNSVGIPDYKVFEVS